MTGNPEGTKLWVALQRDKDKSLPTRILEYSIADGTWRSFTYELEATDVAGDWMGLSEIVFVSEDADGVHLGLIERDKGTGPDARIKHITEMTIAPDAADGDVLAKSLVHDVLPDLQATNGWTQEKLEGMTIDAAGNVFVVTDNDGLDDINGETVFLNLGKVFGDVTRADVCSAPEPTPSADPSPTASPAPGKPGLPSTGA